MNPLDINNVIDSADEAFAKTVDLTQKRMLSEVLVLAKDLELKNGQIVPNVANLKKINTIKSKLNKIVLNKDYLKGVKDLLSSFDEIQQQQFNYFSTISEFKPNEKYSLLKQIAIEQTANQLTESGIDANVTGKLKDILLKSVTSGGSYQDLIKEMSNFLTDNDNGLGALNRYARTYTTTALNQFAGQSNQIMLQDTQQKWFRYVGSNIETTRCWCEKMTKKEYIHISEFTDIIYNSGCETNSKTDLPSGMIDGTNENNLVINRGGWNCRHQMYAVSENSVPKAIRDKITD